MIVLLDIQLLVRLLLEAPSISLAAYPIDLPLKSLLGANLIGFCGLHTFFTEGAERLRKESATTIQLVCISTCDYRYVHFNQLSTNQSFLNYLLISKNRKFFNKHLV